MREKMLTAREVADLFGIHIRTVYRLTKEGKLPCYKIGNRYRYRLDELRGAYDERGKGSNYPL